MNQLPQESKPLWCYLIRRGFSQRQSTLICWRDAGYNWSEIQEIYQVSRSTVSRWTKEIKASI